MAGMKKQINQIDERSQRAAVLLETDVARKLNLLYEGHDAIMETLGALASKSRIEAMADDIILLKSVRSTISPQIPYR